MSLATDGAAGGATAPHDPSIERLAPTTSPRRNTLLAVTIAAVLAAAALWPAVLRPSVVDVDAYSGSWTAIPASAQVVVVITLDPATWPWADVLSVSDVAGASVAGSWLVTGTGLDSLGAADIDGTQVDSGIEYLEIAALDLPISDDALPARVDRHEPAALVVLWDITDCSALAVDAPAAVATVDLRAAVGTTRTHALPDFASPASSPDVLLGFGICP